MRDTLPSQDSILAITHGCYRKPQFVLCILSLYDFPNWNLFPSSSQQPFPERLRIRVSRISMHDYEALHYDKEKLKEACEYEIHILTLQFSKCTGDFSCKVINLNYLRIIYIF